MVIPPDMMAQMAERMKAGEPLVSELTLRALGMKQGEMPTDQEDHVFDTPEGHRAEVPAANGIMTARDLAKMYACLGNYGELDGTRILSEERVRIMSEQQTCRPDR